MQEKLQATIPNSNKWHTDDLDVKAQKFGISKSDFILNAVDMMMNFDETLLGEIQQESTVLHIPEWLVIQNKISNKISIDSAVGVKTPKNNIIATLTLDGSEKFIEQLKDIENHLDRTIEKQKSLKASSIKIGISSESMVVLKVKSFLSTGDINEIETKYSKKFGCKVVILEPSLEIIDVIDG